MRLTFSDDNDLKMFRVDTTLWANSSLYEIESEVMMYFSTAKSSVLSVGITGSV